MEIYHEKFNLDKRDNLSDLPAVAAIFGIFAIVNEEPANCRYVDVTDNLQQAVRDLYESPPGNGMLHFMHGAWIPMLVYELRPGVGREEMEREKAVWIKQYSPKIDEEGEYPGYYE